jgi:hypothetical protein
MFGAQAIMELVKEYDLKEKNFSQILEIVDLVRCYFNITIAKNKSRKHYKVSRFMTNSVKKK